MAGWWAPKRDCSLFHEYRNIRTTVRDFHLQSGWSTVMTSLTHAHLVKSLVEWLVCSIVLLRYVTFMYCPVFPVLGEELWRDITSSLTPWAFCCSNSFLTLQSLTAGPQGTKWYYVAWRWGTCWLAPAPRGLDADCSGVEIVDGRWGLRIIQKKGWR